MGSGNSFSSSSDVGKSDEEALFTDSLKTDEDWSDGQGKNSSEKLMEAEEKDRMMKSKELYK